MGRDVRYSPGAVRETIGEVARRFVELEDWVRSRFSVGETAWRWCNEDYDTSDRVPYAGEPDPARARDFHIATGFNAWGIRTSIITRKKTFASTQNIEYIYIH